MFHFPNDSRAIPNHTFLALLVPADSGCVGSKSGIHLAKKTRQRAPFRISGVKEIGNKADPEFFYLIKNSVNLAPAFRKNGET